MTAYAIAPADRGWANQSGPMTLWSADEERVLYDLRFHDAEDIAALMGRSINAVRSRASRLGILLGYFARRASGYPLPPATVVRRYIEERVERDPTTGCWLWTGSLASNGYGRASIWNHRWLAHRCSYDAFIGPIQGDLFVCHRCDTPACVNPQHLFLGVAQDNSADMVSKGRVSRPKGERNTQAKLTESDVRDIKRRLGREPAVQIANDYGVAPQTVASIKSGKSWGWLKVAA